VDEEKFNPESITMREAINRGWASYDANSKEVTINVAAIRSNARAEEEGELAISVLRAIGTSAEITVKVAVEGGNVKKVESIPSVDIPSDVKERLKGKLVQGGVSFEIDTTSNQVTVNLQFPNKLVNPVFYKKTTTGVVELKDVAGISSVSYDEDTGILTFKITDNSDADTDKTAGRISDPIYYGADSVETTTPTTVNVTAGGGGGCSVTPATPASGVFNLGVLLSGLLGLFGFRRKKH